MKTISSYITACCAFILCLLSVSSLAQEPSFAPDAIIVKFREGVVFQVPVKQEVPVKFNIPAVDLLNLDRSCTEARQIMKARNDLSSSRAFLLHFSGTPDILKLVNEYMNTGLFQYVEPDYVAEAIGDLATLTPPNDLYFYHQWNLYNDGTFQFGPVKIGADIHMLDAWQIEQGDTSIVASFIDSGSKIDHPELASRIWTNPGETPGNGIDDDGNGYVDDIHGWNFSYSSNDVTDDFWHGTAVASVTGAAANNGFGYAGVDWQCKLQIVKVLDSAGSGTTSRIIDGIYYAVDNGGHVLNMSLVVPASQALKDAIDYAYAHNVTVVAASGNTNGGTPLYPAAYPTVIAVGATSANDERPRVFFCGNTGSSYGNHLAVVAPGDMVPVLFIGNDYDFGYYYGCGTSFAAPHVVGVCTLLLAQDSTRTPDELKSIIMTTADDQVGDPREDIPGRDKYYGGGRVNAYRALTWNKNILGIGNQKANPLSIYPNPTTGIVYLKVPEILGPITGSITITDATGVLQQQIATSISPTRLDLSALPDGLYIITLNDGRNLWRERVVKLE